MTHALRTRDRMLSAYYAGTPIAEILETCGASRSALRLWRLKSGGQTRDRCGPQLGGRLIIPLVLLKRLIGEQTTRSGVQKARQRYGLPSVYLSGWHDRLRVSAAAIALLLLASAAQAQEGWVGHGVQHPDPFASMRNIQHGEPGFGCCSGTDCAYTDQCTAAGGVDGVWGPDSKCHAIPPEAEQVRGCPQGKTSACFIGPLDNLKMICSCRGGV